MYRESLRINPRILRLKFYFHACEDNGVRLTLAFIQPTPDLVAFIHSFIHNLAIKSNFWFIHFIRPVKVSLGG